MPKPNNPSRSAYIAGPMTGIPEFNFPMFDAVAERLRADGWVVISPAEMDRADGFDESGLTGHEALTNEQRHRFAHNDIGALLRVDAIVMLPGWRNSTGARNEYSVASWLGRDTLEWIDGELSPIAAGPQWSSTAPGHRAKLLREAEQLVTGDRNAQYGDPRQDFRRTATMWSAYLGADVRPHDVAALMSLLKLSRIRWSPTKEDSWVDLAGYAACGWDCAAEITEVTSA